VLAAVVAVAAAVVAVGCAAGTGWVGSPGVAVIMAGVLVGKTNAGVSIGAVVVGDSGKLQAICTRARMTKTRRMD
jgi:hypothetical protein